MSFESCISSLNLQAAALIQIGDTKRATALLVKALSSLSSHLNGDMSPEFSLAKPGTCVGAATSTASKVIIVDHPHASFMSSSAMPFYNRPFLLESSSSEYSVTDMAETSALLLFNMALACHQEGVTTGKSKRTSTALLLYHKALSALEGSAIQESSNLVLLLLAIVNNMACIQVETFDSEGLQRSRSMLRYVLLHEDNAEIVAEHGRFYFLNLVFLDDEHKLPAAA
jgi:hypothetical protein